MARWAEAACGLLIGMVAAGLSIDVAWAEDIQRVTPQSQAGVQLSFAPIVKLVAPAVVNVYATRVQDVPANPLYADPFFRNFLGGDDDDTPRQQVSHALGSGVVVQADGLVVTNYHVVQNATEVKVALADKREFEASVVLKDQKADLAVLRLKGVSAPLATLPLAQRDSLEVGDLVLAVGDPFGVGQTVTSGIVSALARSEASLSDFNSFIQTDAAINPGNSGGALVDMQGRLAGINTAIVSRSGGNIGIGFAIPAAMVRVVVDAAERGIDHVQRPWFGATVQDVTADSARALGLDRPNGAIVAKVMAGSPAERAGLRTGDVVVSLDGRPIADPGDFNYRFATDAIGSRAPIEVMRGGDRFSAEVELQPAPESRAADRKTLDGPSPLAGATVENLSPATAEGLGMDVDASGVVVAEIGQDTTAAQLGFQPKDIVLALNGHRVTSTTELDELVREPQRVWRVTISRNGQQLTSLFGG